MSSIPRLPLPPQAPSSRPPSSSRYQGPSGDANYVENANRSSLSSRRSKGRRGRSSSDGVRMMNERYQREQQQYQQQFHSGGAGGEFQQINNYPVQQYQQHPSAAYGNQPPGPPPRHIGRSSSDHSGRGEAFDAPFGMDLSSAPNYGSIPSGRPRTSSKEFSPMGELSSVIGRAPSGAGAGPRGSRSPASKGRHRRTMSDSMALRRAQEMQMPPLPTLHQGNPLVMDNPLPTEGGHSEMESFLQSHMSTGNGGAPGGYKSGRPKTHMRQNSVNLYMKSFKGEKQPAKCRDLLFAVLFFVQLTVTAIVELKFGPEALVATAEELGGGEGLQDDDAQIDSLADPDSDYKIVLAYQNVVKMACTCGAFAVIVSALALAFMMSMSRRLVYVALVLSIGVSFAWGTIGIGISPKSFVPITGIIALMLTVGYMFVVWDRIPFASANLTAALAGVRDNLGLVGVAFFFQLLALAVSIYYSVTFVGLHDVMTNELDFNDRTKVGLLTLLVVSYYWTYQVLRHVVMVTVAGTIGSWWFSKPSALKETFFCATFHNFGSVCHGSLFVGFVQLLRQITEGLRPNSDGSAMTCLYECTLFFQERIVGCVDSLADSYTPWAFTYVGLYGYDLKEAGHMANELFDRRGWSRIVTDDLISSVLMMVSLVIGGLSGSFAVILQALDGHGLTSFGHPVLTSFTFGFLIGLVVSSVLFSIIESSVCAVIVCFAGSPVEFHREHPALSHEMRHAWKEVWPGSLDVDAAGAGLV